ncbi:hypothetical protein FJT64_019267 [Amphibalanus amphitrite]|uniref:Uncharacterized protein n=1 Tax=Amphibalanus amphitrite TaxID=1232801 RepID=A0A6A4WUH2_AMPAM|nr:hypothetical protein FJT64_019267 [Amphibalanus amphitrite]
MAAAGMWNEMQLITARNEGREDYMARLDYILGLVSQRTECKDGEEMNNLLSLLDLNTQDIVQEHSTGQRPVLVEEGDAGITLHVEGEQIVAGLGMKEAILLLTAGHCVFAQKYGSSKNVVIFIERAVFKIRQTAYVPRRVRAAMDILE